MIEKKKKREDASYMLVTEGGKEREGRMRACFLHFFFVRESWPACVRERKKGINKEKGSLPRLSKEKKKRKSTAGSFPRSIHKRV